MSYTWVDICNDALIRCGAALIASLTDKPNGILCAAVYEKAIDEIIQENEKGWSDTIERVTVNVDATAPEGTDWDYRYLLPASPWCLKVLAIEESPDYVIEGRYLLTNQETSIALKYAKRITDPTTINSHLAAAISARIAEKIVYRVVQDRLFMQAVKLLCKDDIVKFKGDDAMQSASASTDEKGGYTWTENRGGIEVFQPGRS